jgi:uncharacterized protein (TIGR00730 family)
MPTVRLSGTVKGGQDQNRALRAKLLYLLYGAGWDIYNSNGDQTITLSNIERKIIEANAFVFTPDASLEDLFKAISIFVGYQTLDANLKNKPTVLMNPDGSWDSLATLLDHLHELGTVMQKHREYLLVANEPEKVLELLEKAVSQGVPDVGRIKEGTAAVDSFDLAQEDPSRKNVCVFCSASIKDAEYLQDGYEMGAALARAGYGCVSGAGRTGIMGTVVQGAVEAGGWTGGSNVPHIIELEGLPVGLSSFWLRPDIYTRMEVMIDRSDAFVIFPGGAGTVQEMLALMIFQQQQNPHVIGKPVVVFNRLDRSGKRFWTPLIEMLHASCGTQAFIVVDELDQIVPAIREAMR